MPKNTPSIDDNRLKSVNLTIIFAFFVVLLKLFYWQIIQGQKIRNENISQTSKLISTLPIPGKILSSDNFPLSLNIKEYKMSIYKPNLKISIDELLKNIEEIRPDTISKNIIQINNLNNNNIKWVTFNGKFSQIQKEKLKIAGVEYEEINSRFYPEKDLAKNILINLESFYKRSINGKMGFSLSSIDGTGQSILTKRNWKQNQIDGQDIKISLNRQIQNILEQTIKKGIDTYLAKSASGIIIDPSTGNIIGMAYLTSDTIPTTNIGNIANLFEPGSIFKPIVVAMALDSNKISTDYICSDCDRERVFGQYTINNWDKTFHPNSTLQDIIKNSDNIGMSNIIGKMGKDIFQNYFHSLKLDLKNNIDLIGESVAPQKKYYSDIDLATASFGQGLAVNEIQMIQAFNVLANKGKLVSVHLNTKIPIIETQIFSTDTTNKVVSILKYAVENGAIKNLKPKNLEVCAKSGTAQISVNGQYNESQTIGSYIGFSPCINPKFTMLITINQPQNSQYGSSTAAPLWYELAQKISLSL